MYVVVQHAITDAPTAFERGRNLITGARAPEGVRVLQFFPATDASKVTCLWEAPSVDAVQGYVDTTLGDSSVNTSYEVDADQAFAERPLGLAARPAIPA